MPSEPDPRLVKRVAELADRAGHDPDGAIRQFDSLVRQHGRRVLGAALVRGVPELSDVLARPQ